MKKILYKTDTYRVIEELDACHDMRELKGDTYTPQYNQHIDISQLLQEEKAFERMVQEEGVYGYKLERWNPEIDCGWEVVDGCYGFIGRYSIDHDHYIVEELCRLIPA